MPGPRGSRPVRRDRTPSKGNDMNACRACELLVNICPNKKFLQMHGFAVWDDALAQTEKIRYGAILQFLDEKFNMNMQDQKFYFVCHHLLEKRQLPGLPVEVQEALISNHNELARITLPKVDPRWAFRFPDDSHSTLLHS
ncbi:hypothetical protein IL306_000111 [Fusarium sp. DS 682]|nr:hypothetical protein IL306_000111 [Fusarium sp. DS 682]